MANKIYHYARWRRGRYLIACDEDNKSHKGYYIRKDIFFNCKRCLKVVTGKRWSYFFNAGYAEKFYREGIYD
jgi:hypothetical protein